MTKRVLIIDDNEDQSGFLKMKIMSLGNYEIFEEKTIWGGVLTAISERPDYIFIDVLLKNQGNITLKKFKSVEEEYGPFEVVLGRNNARGFNFVSNGIEWGVALKKICPDAKLFLVSVAKKDELRENTEIGDYQMRLFKRDFEGFLWKKEIHEFKMD